MKGFFFFLGFRVVVVVGREVRGEVINGGKGRERERGGGEGGR